MYYHAPLTFGQYKKVQTVQNGSVHHTRCFCRSVYLSPLPERHMTSGMVSDTSACRHTKTSTPRSSKVVSILSVPLSSVLAGYAPARTCPRMIQLHHGVGPAMLSEGLGSAGSSYTPIPVQGVRWPRSCVMSTTTVRWPATDFRPLGFCHSDCCASPTAESVISVLHCSGSLLQDNLIHRLWTRRCLPLPLVINLYLRASAVYVRTLRLVISSTANLG